MKLTLEPVDFDPWRPHSDAARAVEAQGMGFTLEPVDFDPFAEEDRSVPFGSLGRGFNRLQQIGTVIGREVGAISDEGATRMLARDQADMARYPLPPSAERGLQEIVESEGFLDAAGNVLKNPGAVASVAGESLVTSVPSIVLSLVGAAAGTAAGPVGTVVGLGSGAAAGSFPVEYASVITETLRESGVDMTDPDQIEDALNNPELMAEAREKGVKRGIPIAILDAVSAGAAGSIARRVGTDTGRRVLAGGTAEVALQSGLGGAGEAAAQIASEGRITSPGEVVLEGVAETVTGVPEIVVGATVKGARRPAPSAGVPQDAIPAEQVIGEEVSADLDGWVEVRGADGQSWLVRKDTTPDAPTGQAAPTETPAEPDIALTPEMLAPDPDMGRLDTGLTQEDRIQPGTGLEVPVSTRLQPDTEPLPVSAQGSPGGQENVPVPVSETQLAEPAQDIRSVVESPRFKAIFGEDANTDSPVTVEHARGFRDALADRTPRATEIEGSSTQRNARFPYLEGYLAGRVGVLSPVRENEVGVIQRMLTDRQPASLSAAAGNTDLESRMADIEARSNDLADPIQLVTRFLSGETSAIEQLEDLQSDVQRIEREIAASYRARSIYDVDEDLFTERERQFLFYSNVPEREDTASLSRMVEPVMDLREAATEVRRIVRDLPVTDDIEGASLPEQIASGRLLFLGSEIERLGGDARRVIRQAAQSEAKRYSDPSDAEFMARNLINRLEPFITPQQPDTQTPLNIPARPPQRQGRIARNRPLDLVEFLAANGGVRDHKGELKALGLRGRLVPGIGQLVRNKGMPLDRARELAEGAGYLTPATGRETTSVSDLLDALDATARGNPVFAEGDRAEMERRGAEAREIEGAAERERVKEEIRDVATKAVITLSDAEMDRVLETMVETGATVQDAIVELLERQGLRDDDGRGTGEVSGETSQASQGTARGAGRRTEAQGQQPDRSQQNDAPEGGQGKETPLDDDIPFKLRLEPAGLADRAPDVTANIRADLGRLGLADVGLRFVEKIRSVVDGQEVAADGRYLKGLIEIALDTADPQATMQHEAIHALRDLGAFTDKEWARLESRSRKVWMKRYDIQTRYGRFPESTQIEEGIAHAYADWSAGGKADLMMRPVFKKIRDIIEAIANGLRGNGFHSASSVFADIQSGEIGQRVGASSKGDAKLSIRSRDGDLFASEVVETEDGPADQFVVPGAERISDRELAERRAAGKKRTSKAQKGTDDLPLFGDDKNQGELFHLRREPKTDADGQRLQQGFLARGQFIDRAVRAPFAVFGGIDKQGRWKPGAKLTDKAGRIIGEAKFHEDGLFAWMNPTLETLRRGLIDRYGLSEEYLAAERSRGLDARRIMAEGADFLKGLQSDNISVEEARVLQSILTGEKVDDTDMQKLAQPIREAIDQLGQEAVSLGLLDAAAYEKNRGTYLHRVYLKHEADKSGLSRFADKVMSGNRKKIIGSQFKGRGIFLDIDAPRLLKNDPRWPRGERGRPEVGEKFRVLDLQQEAFDTAQTPKVVDRVYLPAGQKVPAEYAQYTDKGVWEVRAQKGKRLVLWRDFTKAERKNMGEIMDARYTIGKTYMLMANDLSTGRFYQQIATNEDWARKTEPQEKTVDAADLSLARHLFSDTETQWIKVPDSTIPKSGGKKRWGALAGMYVRAEIWRDLTELNRVNTPGSWRALLTQWKLNKTARSPVVHTNNVMSNLIFMDLADIRAQDLVKGIQSFVKGDQNYQDALEHGAFGSDMMSQEIRDNVLKPILDEISKDMQEGKSNSLFARGKLVGVVADKVWSFAKAADRRMVDAYRIEDEVFRMATYMRRRAMGDDAFSAADFARRQFLDYDIRAPWVNAARNSLLPFISYTYRAAPLIAEAIAHRPWKLAKYYALAYAANALAYGWDEEGNEEKEHYSLRDQEQGYTWIFVPRMLRMPFRNQHGLPQFLDIRRWIPAGDIFDTNQGQSAVPIPAPIQFGGPLAIGAELFLNRSAFTGQDITNTLTDDWYDTTGKVSDFLYKSWMPSAAWIPNSWYWEKIGNAMRGATDSQGRPNSITGAVLSSVGIKLKPQDVEQNLFWKGYGLQQVERELKAQARRLARQRERKLISEEVFDNGMAAIQTKYQRLQERAEELSRISSQ